ncbi:MAG: glycerophosphodiester phosphodiesterase [Spirochaetota bacterium]
MAEDHRIGRSTLRGLPRATAAPLVFGHRGYSALAPENTLPAFEAIRRHGVPGVELDAQLCATGEVVVCHDETLERVAGVDLRIKDTGYDELRRLDVGSWFADSFAGERLPRLQDVFDLLGDHVVYDIELKTRSTGEPARRLAESVIQLIEAHSIAHACILSSFNPFAVWWSRRRTRRIPTALIYTSAKDAPPAARFSASQRILGNELLKPDRHVFAREIARMRPPYPAVPRLVWTVDDPEEKRRIAAGKAEGAREPAAPRAGTAGAGRDAGPPTGSPLRVYGIISNDPLDLAGSRS